MKNKKNLFENVNIEWNLGSGEDGSTDFSDDDLIDEKVRTLTHHCILFSFSLLFLRHLLFKSHSLSLLHSLALMFFFIPPIASIFSFQSDSATQLVFPLHLSFHPYYFTHTHILPSLSLSHSLFLSLFCLAIFSIEEANPLTPTATCLSISTPLGTFFFSLRINTCFTRFFQSLFLSISHSLSLFLFSFFITFFFFALCLLLLLLNLYYSIFYFLL